MISMTLFAFQSLLKDVLDEHTPVIEKRIKKQVQLPWMSNDIKEAMKRKGQAPKKST